MLAFFAANAVVAARTNTPTPDEFVYVPAGLYHLKTGDLSFDPTNPPLLKMLMAAPLAAMDLKLDLDPSKRDNSSGWGPWIFGTSFMNLNRERYVDAFFAARLVVIAIGALLAALVYLRARELLSPAAALATLLLFATMPTVVAHSAVATLDVGVSALMFAGLVAATRFATTKAWGWAAATGAMFGLGLAVKGTAALYAPLVPVLVAIDWKDWKGAGLRPLRGGRRADGAGGVARHRGGLRLLGFPAARTAARRHPLPGEREQRGRVPGLPAGQLVAEGLVVLPPGHAGPEDAAALPRADARGPGGDRARLAPAAIARARRGHGRDRRARDLAILLPPLFFVYVLSFHYAKDYGVRYLLPALPFLALIAGRGVDLLLASGRQGRVALAVLLAWQTAACAVSAPDPLAYFNEFVGGPDRGRRLLLDSNLDWGQDLGRAADYFRERGIAKPCLALLRPRGPARLRPRVHVPAGDPEGGPLRGERQLPGRLSLRDHLRGRPHPRREGGRVVVVRPPAAGGQDRRLDLRVRRDERRRREARRTHRRRAAGAAEPDHA